MRNTILMGDVREQLCTLKEQSVHCVVTSPPYWGLRDYGTASWEGGDEACDHKADFKPRGSRPASGLHSLDWMDDAQAPIYRDVCGKCGARRVDNQIGLEATPEAYVENMVAVFREVRRVLRKDGTVWLNLGDSYASGEVGRHDKVNGSDFTTQWVGRERQQARVRSGLKPKDLVGIPWRVAFALQADGWWLRSDIIWSKPNPMPESVTDRPTKAHEYIFLLAKSQTYYYDADAIREAYAPASIARISQPNFENQTGGAKDYGPDSNRSMRKTLENFARSHRGSTFTNGKTAATKPNVGQGEREDNPSGRNKRTVWEIATQPYPEAHFATYPEELVKPCILAGTSEYGCCAECGAPWERVVEREAERFNEKEGIAQALRNAGATNGGTERVTLGVTEYVERRTTGWRPTCTHEAPIVPAIVLDPFFGSGTTGLVAAKAGRDWLGIELNPTYVQLAEKRLAPVKSRLL